MIDNKQRDSLKEDYLRNEKKRIRFNIFKKVLTKNVCKRELLITIKGQRKNLPTIQLPKTFIKRKDMFNQLFIIILLGYMNWTS